MVAAAAAAVTSDDFCVLPPTARTTAVCEVPPPAGMAPRKAPHRLAAPLANSSRSALIGGSDDAAKALPAAIVSVKLIKAMPSAPGSNWCTRPKSGRVIDGNPCGITPTVATPAAFNAKNHDAAIPPAMAASGAGEWGSNFSKETSKSSVAMVTARVVIDVPGMLCATLKMSWKKLCLTMWMPSSFGN